MGRSRQIIIPIQARSRSIENVAGARLENSLTEFAQQTPHRRFQASLLGTIIYLELFIGYGVKSNRGYIYHRTNVLKSVANPY